MNLLIKRYFNFPIEMNSFEDLNQAPCLLIIGPIANCCSQDFNKLIVIFKRAIKDSPIIVILFDFIIVATDLVGKRSQVAIIMIIRDQDISFILQIHYLHLERQSNLMEKCLRYFCWRIFIIDQGYLILEQLGILHCFNSVFLSQNKVDHFAFTFL